MKKTYCELSVVSCDTYKISDYTICRYQNTKSCGMYYGKFSEQKYLDFKNQTHKNIDIVYYFDDFIEVRLSSYNHIYTYAHIKNNKMYRDHNLANYESFIDNKKNLEIHYNINNFIHNEHDVAYASYLDEFLKKYLLHGITFTKINYCLLML